MLHFCRVFTLFLLFSFCPKLTLADKIDVGVILPLSGDLAVFGDKLRKGIELGLLSYSDRFNLVVEDGEFSNTKALSGLHKIMQTSTAGVVIGPFGPGQTFTLAPVAQKKNVALVAVSLCEGRFSSSKNALCVYPGVPMQFQPILELYRANQTAKIRTIGLLLEEIDSVEEMVTVLSRFSEEIGAKVIAIEKFTSGTSDFRSMLLKMKEADLIAIAAFPITGVTALKQLKELGINPQHRWLWTEHDHKIIKDNKAYLEGVYIPGGLTQFNPQFVKEFNERYNQKPDLYHAIAYDAASAVFEVLSQEPRLRGDALVQKLIDSKLSKSACPGFKFKQDHTVEFPLDVAIVKNGAVHVLKVG